MTGDGIDVYACRDCSCLFAERPVGVASCPACDHHGVTVHTASRFDDEGTTQRTNWYQRVRLDVRD